MEMNMLGGAVKREIQIYKTSKKTGKSREREAPGDTGWKALKFNLLEQLSKLSTELTLNVEISGCAFVKKNA